jgi:tripartite-type tricarboxylate transporter receptor subunit TctC
MDLSFGSLIQTLPFIKSGHLRALGVGGRTRNAALPDIPTIAEAGVPGYEAINWWGMMAPAGTPAPIIDRLNRELTGILKSKELNDKFATEGAETLQMTTEEFKAFVNTETAKWVKVAREGNIRLDN